MANVKGIVRKKNHYLHILICMLFKKCPLNTKIWIVIVTMFRRTKLIRMDICSITGALMSSVWGTDQIILQWQSSQPLNEGCPVHVCIHNVKSSNKSTYSKTFLFVIFHQRLTFRCLFHALDWSVTGTVTLNYHMDNGLKQHTGLGWYEGEYIMTD